MAQPAGPDTGKQLGATAEAYVRYVVRRGAGLKLIFAPGLEHLHDEDSIDAGCELMSAAAPPRGELGGPQPTLRSWGERLTALARWLRLAVPTASAPADIPPLTSRSSPPTTPAP